MEQVTHLEKSRRYNRNGLRGITGTLYTNPVVIATISVTLSILASPLRKDFGYAPYGPHEVFFQDHQRRRQTNYVPVRFFA